ncbi:hypothetical protein H2200_001147 [Cladophialophora chaetospira]|uniref:Uncharacterized protein n=1 Tax=Cladophialophora chaetospira TaxID=386627 RepID=A0AA38XLA1_9EURO|nr:hypothetical protein H2200_001147 [Cladophialophora chaetospira]
MYHTGKDIKDCDKKCQCAQPIPRRSIQAGACQGEGVPAHQVRDLGTGSALYCADTTDCLFLLTFNVPLCWDKFTTDYYLPDGSYGSVTSGNYTTSNGDQANLITGMYRLANGSTGNIYQGDTLDEPNTSSMPIPTAWTSSGVGSVIPASELGSRPSSNSSGMMPTFASTASTSTSGTVDAHTTTAFGNLCTSSPVANTTTVPEATPGAATSTSATASAPDITPPTTDAATMSASHSLLLLTLGFAVVTVLVTR